MTELKSYIKLKHYPPQGTNEYLNSLPPGIPYRLYKILFADGEVGQLVETRLLHLCSDPQLYDIVWKYLEALLVDYYEAYELKQQLIDKVSQWKMNI